MHCKQAMNGFFVAEPSFCVGTIYETTVEQVESIEEFPALLRHLKNRLMGIAELMMVPQGNLYRINEALFTCHFEPDGFDQTRTAFVVSKR